MKNHLINNQLPIFLFAFLLLSGCASTMENGSPTPSVQIGKAVIFTNSSLINFPKANMSIYQVDDKILSTKYSLKQIYTTTLTPGTHNISVGFYSRGYASEANINASFLESHVYEISASLIDGKMFDAASKKIFDVTLEDVTNTQRKLIHKTTSIGYRAP